MGLEKWFGSVENCTREHCNGVRARKGNGNGTKYINKLQTIMKIEIDTEKREIKVKDSVNAAELFNWIRQTLGDLRDWQIEFKSFETKENDFSAFKDLMDKNPIYSRPFTMDTTYPPGTILYNSTSDSLSMTDGQTTTDLSLENFN